MAYEKHVWQTNEIITADKLNHIEDALEGSGSGDTADQVSCPVFVVHIYKDGNHYVTQETVREVYAAIDQKRALIGYIEFEDGGIWCKPLYMINNNNEGEFYSFRADFGSNGFTVFVSISMNDTYTTNQTILYSGNEGGGVK